MRCIATRSALCRQECVLRVLQIVCLNSYVRLPATADVQPVKGAIAKCRRYLRCWPLKRAATGGANATAQKSCMISNLVRNLNQTRGLVQKGALTASDPAGLFRQNAPSKACAPAPNPGCNFVLRAGSCSSALLCGSVTLGN